MLTLSAWQPTATFDPNDPTQRVRTLYLPNAGEYRSIYWNEVSPGSSNILNGLGMTDPKNIFIGLGLLAVGLFAVAKLTQKERGHLSGARRRRRR